MNHRSPLSAPPNIDLVRAVPDNSKPVVIWSQSGALPTCHTGAIPPTHGCNNCLAYRRPTCRSA